MEAISQVGCPNLSPNYRQKDLSDYKYILQPDGSYVKIDKRGKTLVNSQAYFCKEAVGEAKDMEEESLQIRRVFEPLYHVDE